MSGLQGPILHEITISNWDVWPILSLSSSTFQHHYWDQDYPIWGLLRLLKEHTISHNVKIKIWLMFFFQGVLPNSSSPHMQSQRNLFIKSKPHNKNTPTTRLHNHAVFSNEMKQQQTGQVLLMSRATLANNFLTKQAMFTIIKSCAHFIYLQLGCQMKMSIKYTHGCQKNTWTNTKHRDDKEDNKNTFIYYSTRN